MHSFGWKPQRPDYRDKNFKDLLGMNLMAAQGLPPSVDMRPKCPDVYDQGNLGSCTANAIAFACQFDLMKQKPAHHYVPSRLFIYYNEREMEGSIPYDSGANLRDGIKSLNTWGFAPETSWPYVISQFATQPPLSVYREALKEKVAIKDYGAVNQTLTDMQTALAAGYPIVLGFLVYSSMETAEVAKTGVVPLPAPNDTFMGGHAIAVVGYDNATQTFLCRNSWGEGWGQKGYFTVPYAYFLSPQLASDFWVVRAVPKV